MINLKHNINDIVYIYNNISIIECIVKEIHITDSNIKYRVQNKQYDYEFYNVEENEIFNNQQDAQKFIQEKNLINKINDKKLQIAQGKEWISDLNYAIQNHKSCKININIIKMSGHTNINDVCIFSVTAIESKTLLQYIKKYYEEMIKSIENTIEELKKTKKINEI